MPRYFFKLRNGGTVVDEEGEELADDLAATRVAIEVFAETLPSKAEALIEGGGYEVMVTNAENAEVFRIFAQGRWPVVDAGGR